MIFLNLSSNILRFFYICSCFHEIFYCAFFKKSNKRGDYFYLILFFYDESNMLFILFFDFSLRVRKEFTYMAIKYKQLAGILKKAIADYPKKGITRLPTEQTLCQRYHVSRQTVRKALSLLEENGLIIKKQGSGSFITGLSEDPVKNQIQILISDEQDYIYPGVLKDISDELEQYGFQSGTLITDNQTGLERIHLTELLKEPPRGLIAEGCKSALPNPNLDLYRKLCKAGCHVLFLYNYYPALPDSLYLKDQNQKGSRMLLEYLLQQGRRQIGGIFKFDDLQGIERFQGFTEGMRDHRLSLPDSRVFWYGSMELKKLLTDTDTGFLKSMIPDVLGSCDSLICYNDVIAYYLIRELRRSGCHVPDDIAVVSFDNTYFSDSSPISVTTLSHRPHEMGRRAARLIIDAIKGLPVQSQEVPWQLMIKDSTD